MPAPMTDLDTLEALEKAATPGPWRRDSSGQIVQTAHITRDVWVIPKCVADLDLIAALRNAAPALLRRLRRLEAVAEAAVRIREGDVDKGWPALLLALRELEEVEHG